MCGRAHAINARRAKPASKSLQGPHCPGHAIAISDATFVAYFNLQDRLAETLIVHDGDIAELETPCLVRSQPSIDREQHIVVKLSDSHL